MSARKYEIIATLGPASDAPLTWQALLDAGATGFRLNTSHLTLEQLGGWLERLSAFRLASAAPFALALDLQGSKWRLGQLSPQVLAEGQPVELILAREDSRPGVLPVPHADFFSAAPASNGEVVLNDAKVRLRLETSGGERLSARVTLGGEIAANKGVTFSGGDYRTEHLSEKDQSILETTRGLDWLRYAISYVKDASEMRRYRALADERLGRPGYLIAKLERGPAVEQAAAMTAWADELWLCRGDLGAELGLAGMARAAARLNEQVGQIAAPVIMAGQVLEHMSAHATPTRSEVCYLHDSLARGYRGFVLSDETAVGRYPVESCRAAAIFQP